MASPIDDECVASPIEGLTLWWRAGSRGSIPVVSTGDLLVAAVGYTSTRAAAVPAQSIWCGTSENGRGSLPLVIADSYRTRGVSACLGLGGAYCFAICDFAEQVVYIGGDALGIMPLFYRSSAETLWWGTDIVALLQASASERVPSPAFIDAYLQGACVAYGAAYKDVSMLHPGAVLCAGRQGWRLQDLAVEVATTDASDHDSVRDALFRSVATALGNNTTCLAELSGGLDSTTIVRVADHLQKSQQLVSRIQTVSYISSVSSADERRWIRAVETARRDPTFGIPYEQYCTLGTVRK